MWRPLVGEAQNTIVFQCYNLDSISWNLSLPGCSDSMIDSFQILTRTVHNSEFTVQHTGTDPSVRGYKNESLKTDDAIQVRYYLQCPDIQTAHSDTLSLSSLREAVELDSVRVLANGDVRLTWKEKPLAGVRYVVNAAVGGSSQVLATNLTTTTYTDTRGLATHNIEYYSVSATLQCGYTFPEPDSFYHTSYLSQQTAECGGEIMFDFIPFSYWKDLTATSTLFVLRNGEPVDSVAIPPYEKSFSYGKIENDQTYTFYIRETGTGNQAAFSNPITLQTDFFSPIQWIVVDDLSFDENNQARISWSTNQHNPGYLFQLHQDTDTSSIPASDLASLPGDYRYGYDLPDVPSGASGFSVSLLDSCGNSVESIPKFPLLTQGQLTSNNQLNIQWNDVADDEWTVDSYEIYYKTGGNYSLLSTENGTSFSFSQAFEEGKSIDSLCYYVVAKGEVRYQKGDSTGQLSIRSNTMCLYGETIVELPNAYKINTPPYKPVIVPRNNLTSYVFRIFDRYGNLVFETHDPEAGWDGRYQGKSGFMDVFVAQIEIVNSRGESISRSGSVLLFY